MASARNSSWRSIFSVSSSRLLVRLSPSRNSRRRRMVPGRDSMCSLLPMSKSQSSASLWTVLPSKASLMSSWMERTVPVKSSGRSLARVKPFGGPEKAIGLGAEPGRKCRQEQEHKRGRSGCGDSGTGDRRWRGMSDGSDRNASVSRYNLTPKAHRLKPRP